MSALSKRPRLRLDREHYDRLRKRCWSVTDGDVNVAARHRSFTYTIFNFAAGVEKTPTAT